MGATMVPWSDVVPDEIRSTDLIAQVGGFGEICENTMKGST